MFAEVPWLSLQCVSTKCEEQHVSGGTGQYDVRLLIMDRGLCLHGHVLCLNPECVSQIGLPKNLRDAAAWGVA